MQIFSAAMLALSAYLGAAPLKPTGGLSTLSTPWVIAHRGGPLIWPEETMEAYRASTGSGNLFVEVDCYLLKDGIGIGVMHDASLERTTNVKKPVSQVAVGEWKKLRIDGQKLLGSGWGSYEAPFFDEILAVFGNKKIIVVEPKNAGSGAAIVAKLKQYGISKDFVLLNSFLFPNELKPAIAAGYKTCPNLNPDPQISPEAARKAGYWAVGLPANTSEQVVRAFKNAGLRVLIYTANRHFQRKQLLEWGADGIYTDDPLYMDMNGVFRRDSDPFDSQRWAPGMLEGQAGGRGSFVPPNSWRLDTSDANTFKSCLQGWMCPIGGKEVAPAWSMDLSITFGPRLQDGRWASVAILTADVPLNNDAGSFIKTGGYHVLFYNTGGLAIYKYDHTGKKPVTELKGVQGKPIMLGEKVAYRITVTPEKIMVERLDGNAKLEVADADYRGSYVSFGAKGQRADFSAIKVNVPPAF